MSHITTSIYTVSQSSSLRSSFSVAPVLVKSPRCHANTGLVAVEPSGDAVGVERQSSTKLRHVVGPIVGVALCACAAAGYVVRAASIEQPPVACAVAVPARVDVWPAHRTSPDRVPAGVASVSRRPRADARAALRFSPKWASPASAERVYAEVDRRARQVDERLRALIARVILEEAARANIDPLFVVALIHVESGFDLEAVSSAGAAGLMQVRVPAMADVAVRSGMRSTDPLDPAANVQAGVRYLAGLIETFGNVEIALMAYNAGPGRISRYLREGGVPRRFWAYPQNVARELVRLGGSLPVPARARLADDHDPRTRLVQAHQPNAAGPAYAGTRTHRRPSTMDAVVRIDPRGVEHSRGPGRDRRPRWYDSALVSVVGRRVPRSMEAS